VRNSSSFVKTRVGSDASIRTSANTFCDSSTGAPQAHRPRRRVHLELADAQPSGPAAQVRAAQQRLDPRARSSGQLKGLPSTWVIARIGTAT
jgi:hypothetical protein